ncbi:phosphoseryl tRNA kinase isoform X2 [Amblyomma americanum]
MGTGCASVLMLFCGLPASGKTTLVQKIRAALGSRSSTSARGLSWCPYVICYDELVSTEVQAEMASRKGLTKECRQHLLEAADCYIGQLCGDNFEPSHVYEEPVNEMVGRLLAATRQIQPNEKAVIMVDDNLYYRSMRAAWFKLARNYSLGFCQVFLLCTEEEAVRRNASRAFSVPESTIRTMAKKFEAPRDEPWEQLTVTVDGTPDSMPCTDEEHVRPPMNRGNATRGTLRCLLDVDGILLSSSTHDRDISLRRERVMNATVNFSGYAFLGRPGLRLGISGKRNPIKLGTKHGRVAPYH